MSNLKETFEGEKLIETPSITREELIENLYQTDRLVKEIQIIEHEIEKKEKQKEIELRKLQLEFVESELQSYKESEEVKAFNHYKEYENKIIKFDGVAKLLAIFIPVCIAMGLLFLNMPLVVVIGVMVVFPFLLLFTYHSVSQNMINKQKSDMPILDDVVKRNATKSEAYALLSQKNSIKEIMHEINQLYTKKQTCEETLQTESVVADIYYTKVRRLIHFIHKQMADTLKEALVLLVNEERYQQTEEKLNLQKDALELLQEKTEKMQDEMDALNLKIARQQVELEYLRPRRFRNSR